MDLVELRTLLDEVFEDAAPNFEICVASSGEIMIATGLTEDDDGNLIEIDEDFEEDPDLDPDMEPLDVLDEDDE
jgi:hypothetical protein